MKKNIIVTALLLLGSLATFAQVKWNVDPAHTSIVFNVNHLGISYVHGNFTKFTGNVAIADSTNFQNAAVNFTVDVNSINTDVADRDKHLKSDDFFNAEKYPEMTLKTVSFKKQANNKYVLVADLTIRDVTKRVNFDVIYHGLLKKDPWGLTRAGFTAKATINRLDFGVKYADKLPSGVYAVSPKVDIIVNAEVVKAN
jgi:polyisoprenoid-binding protein YceI